MPVEHCCVFYTSVSLSKQADLFSDGVSVLVESNPTNELHVECSALELATEFKRLPGKTPGLED